MTNYAASPGHFSTFPKGEWIGDILFIRIRDDSLFDDHAVFWTIDLITICQQMLLTDLSRDHWSGVLNQAGYF